MRATLLAFIYLICLLIATLFPFDTSLSSRFSMGDYLSGFGPLFTRGPQQFWTSDFRENIVLFIPLGIFLHYALVPQTRSKLASMLWLAGCAGLLSFSVELVQVYFPERVPSATDVLANTVGATVGGLLASCLPTVVPRYAAWLWAKVERSTTMACVVLLYGMVPAVLWLVQFPGLDFRNWNARYTFQLGNEATRNAPWLGKLYRTALYSRALAPAEIVQHYQAGLSVDAQASRGQEGLIALYAFGEGAGNLARDVSTRDASLDLTVTPASHIHWLHGPQGIEMVKPAILESRGPATQFFSALTATSALSIEVWMTPTRLDQIGPARIVSFSQDPFHNNFMFGQQGADIHFQLRTPLSGGRGSPANLKTNNAFLTTEAIFHLVATYADGVARLYVNGSEYKTHFNLAQDAIVGFYATKRPIAQMAYTFFYFFPVSFFLSAYFSTWSRANVTTWFLPFAIAVGLLSLTEIAQAFVFDRAIDLPLLGYGVLTSIVGVFSGKAFVSKALVQPEPA